jgi:hypothetical protein
MKRTELKVGKEYWYSRSTRWEESLTEGSKVVVVDAGCWSQNRSTWSRTNPEPIRVAKGLGVLVDMTVRSYSGGEKVVRKVVNVTTIRGLYEETKKKIEEFTEARTEQYRKDREASDQRDAAIKEAIALAKECGITVVSNGYGKITVSIGVVDLTRLINAGRQNLG